MSKYRNKLPQLDQRLFLTDGGLETTLVFHEGITLPCFAAFDLLKDDSGTDVLRRYFLRYATLAKTLGLGAVLETPTWRANPDWAANHTLPIESIYQHLGGRISVMIKDGAGHHPHSLRDPTLIADFITRSLEPADPAPAFVGKNFIRSSFYSVENSYSRFPKEELYITCRGAWFGETCWRYEFKPDNTTGNVNVIVPKTAAPGRPWVLRADLVPRDAVVDLALLQKGFHIVTAPRPRDPNVTVLQEWNALYKYLVDQGFSAKPVMEGAGAAAGEAYNWAIANPDKVSCVYGENPVLRNNLSKTQSLDNLAPLAKAGVPLLHVCGGRDPWLETQTRVVQKRYQELGGRITVMIKEGEGHYPLAPKNQQPVVDFIVKSVAAPDTNE